MKKLSALLLVFLSVIAYAQTDTLIWSSTGTYPDISLAGMYNESVVVGDTLYAHITGGVATTTFEKYVIGDPSLGGGSWITGTSLPSVLIGGFMVECGGLIYYIGGSASSVTTAGSDVYCYDPANGQWTTKASLPVALSGHGAVAWGDSVIFVMGGPWSTTTTTNLDVYYYRVATNTWGTNTGASGLPSGAGRRAFGIGIDGSSIIISGGYAAAYLKSTYLGTIGADATSITWAQGPDIPSTGGLSRPGGTAIDGHFFLVGGEKENSLGYGDTTHVFNFNTSTWQYSFPGKPTAVSNIFNTVSATKLSGDTVVLFVPGGYNTNGIADLEVAKFYNQSSAGIFSIIKEDNTLSVYPSPASNLISIQTNAINDESVVEIYNIQGQLMDVIDLRQGTEVNIESYAKGVYTIRMQNSSSYTKFIKE